jgi:predicted SAM-dependent methyltransferase
MMVKLNLGCGSVRPVGWINTDSSLNASFQKIPVIGKMITRYFNPVIYNSSNFKYMNLNKKWHFSNNSVDIVYASHLFEHLSLKSADLFLNESRRCLKTGGVIRIVVPDLYKIAKKYIFDFEGGNKDASDYILWAINMHREGQYGNPGWLKKIILELQGYPHQHKYMYDEKSMYILFEKYGFININILTFGDSKLIENIHEVEGDKELYLSVYIEAKKV